MGQEGVMAALPETQGTPLDRRAFVFSMLSFGVTPATAHKEAERVELVYRLMTPECEIQMSVQHFDRSEMGKFRFLEQITQKAFCLSGEGEENQSCVKKFSGSIAIAHYQFRPRSGGGPVRFRERVETIDQDRRMTARSPFERSLTVEREAASDIQAFGYDPSDPAQAAAAAGANFWSLLRQDLFLNGDAAPFAILHWKHTFQEIRLLDIVPGDRTEVA